MIYFTDPMKGNLPMWGNAFLRFTAMLCCALTPLVCAAAVPVGDLRFGYPAPREVAVTGTEAMLPRDFTVNAPARLIPAVDDLRELFAAHGLTLRHTGSAQAFLHLEVSQRGTPENPQGYLLEVEARRVNIASRTPEGLFNGLQTLRMMLLNAKEAKLPCCRIADWPDLERRGIAFSVHGVQRRRLPALKKELCALAALKYNRAVIEFGDNFPFDSRLFPESREKLSAADVAELLKFAEERFIEIVPMLRIWNDCPLVSGRGDVDRLLEQPHSGKDSPYCPLKPELLKLLKTAIGGQCALLHPRSYVFYLDRRGLRQGFRQCAQCRRFSAAELISGHLGELSAACFASGVNVEFIFDHFNRLPVDPKSFSAAGVRSRAAVVGAPGPGGPGAASAGSGSAIRKAVAATCAADGKEFTLLGFESTEDGRIVPLKSASPWFFGDTVNAASALWNPGSARPLADPVAWFFRVYRSAPVGPEAAALPVPLGDVVTAELSQSGRFPFFGDRKELEALREQLAARPEKFRLETSRGGRYYGVLLSGAPNDGLRSEPVTIRLGAFRTPALALLLSCSPPLQQAEYDPMSGGTKLYEYEQVGAVTFNYVNGRSVVKPLRYMVEISDWNRRFGGYGLSLAASGSDAEGRVANWWALRLENPHPELALESLTFSTFRRGGIAPALLALSLLDAEGGKLPPARRGGLRLPDDIGAPKVPHIPQIVVMDFENSRLAPMSVEVRNADFKAGERLDITFPTDPASPSGSRVLKITIPAVKSGDGGRIVISLNLPGAQRGAVRSLGVSCRIDHPEYLHRAFQELADTHTRGTYRQVIHPGKNWSRIWTALGNPDRYSRLKLRDPHRSNMRRVIFCFKELPEPVTIQIDDLAHSRWSIHTLPYLSAADE